MHVYVAPGLHVPLVPPVVVVHEPNHIEPRALGGAHAKGGILEDPGLTHRRAKATGRLEVDVGEHLVATAHLLGCHDVLEEAREVVRLERHTHLAQRRGGRNDHGDTGCR